MKLTGLLTLLLLLSVSSYAQIAENAEDIEPISPGATLPKGELFDVSGETVKITPKDAASSVIVFYRGGWCPYCNVHLSELQGIMDEIESRGYRLIAVSPDSPEQLDESVDKHTLTYTLLSDPALDFARSFGIVFKAPERYLDMLKEKSGGLNEGYLPVPSVFIVDENGEISFVYTNADYKTRLDGESILNEIPE